MGHVAGSDDQHSLLAQRLKLLADPKQPIRVVGWHTAPARPRTDTSLQRHPGTMVQAAARMLVYGLGVRHQRVIFAASADASGVW